MKKPPFDIVVLRHWREKNRDTNSGQLVTDCIAGARVVDMVDESYKNLAAHLPKGNVWLLFPESIDSAGNVVIPTHRGLPDPLPKTIVVVDGTWAEAQRMAKALPGLPRLVPQGGPRASERLLAPPQSGAMATAEAIAALIAEVDPYAAACLDRAYARHVAFLKKSNPYKAAIPIVSGIAYVRNGGKTYADLMQELRWLGPASVVKIVLDGNTRQCGEAAHTVAQYLIERGFTAREDTGAGKYCSHFDLAVYTADSGWITVDPTYVQFSLPNSLSHAHRIVEKKLLTDDSSLTKEEKGARARSVLEPTVAWSVAAMQEPTVAFEVGRKTDRVEGIPKSPSASEPPCEWRDGASWREVWQKYRTIAEDIAKTGTSDGLEHYNLNYWFQQLADRIHGKRISGSVLKSNPAGSALENPIVSGIAHVANPKMVPDVPIEATVRSERIGTKTRELTPGVHVVAQISRTGKEVWLTQGEQRLFLYLQDDQGRGSLFYQSFAGTGGKQQGFWFPSGGILASRRGSGVWVIKGNPKTDPGAGRSGLMALYQKANAVLPHSDAETDAFVKKATRVPYDDFLWEDEYEIKPTMKILEEGHANALQTKWNDWAYRFWSLNALDKTWGKRTFNIKENPTDLVGRHIPDRYLAGLPAALQKQRIGELTESRDAYKRGDYSELPTDVTARKMGLVKQSKYTTEAKKRGIEYRGDLLDMAERVLMAYSGRAPANEVQKFAEALRASFAKGLAAWKSGGHRPGATAQNWATARVNSLVVGGKTSWTADKKLFEVLPAAVRAKIESMRQKQNPISVEVRLDEGYPAGYGGAAEGKHTRFLQSKAALARIVEQGKEVVPRIKFVVDWDKNSKAKRFAAIRKAGEGGVVTLLIAAATHQEQVDLYSHGYYASGERQDRVSLYTAHTILHRLGDNIMPDENTVKDGLHNYPPAVAKDRKSYVVVTDRLDRAWERLGEALLEASKYPGINLMGRWLPSVVATKACREGWIVDGSQALAELVPYRLLYKKGRENGVKLMSDLPFVPQLEKALTEYIDANMEVLKGYEVRI